MFVFAEVVRAMTFVIDQGMAMYWGTSRWNAVEIMVQHNIQVEPHRTSEQLHVQLTHYWSLRVFTSCFVIVATWIFLMLQCFGAFFPFLS